MNFPCNFFSILLSNSTLFLSLIYTFLVSLSFTSFGQITQQNALVQASSQSRSFPSNALVMLADGNEKYISEVHEGDLIASFDPVSGGYTTTLVTQMQKNEARKTAITSALLILEEFSASLQKNGGLAGVTLQAASDQPVLTNNGKKELGKVLEGEMLYCYDETCAQFYAFRVYAVQNNAFVADKTYSLVTENKSYLVNNTVVLDK